MSKTKGEAEPNWAEMDKRIRAGRAMWTTPELEKLNQALSKLPDLSDQAEVIELEQPAIGPRPTETEHGAEASPGAGQPRPGDRSS